MPYADNSTFGCLFFPVGVSIQVVTSESYVRKTSLLDMSAGASACQSCNTVTRVNMLCENAKRAPCPTTSWTCE